MSNKKLPVQNNWKSPQAIIVIAIITIIFAYIISDITIFKPDYDKRLDEVYKKYDSLTIEIQQKFPEFEDELSNQKNQLSRQKESIISLQKYVSADSTLKSLK